MAKENKTKSGNKRVNKNIEKALRNTSEFDSSNDSENILKRFIVLFLIILLVVVGTYFLSKKLVDNRKIDNSNTSISGEINYDITSVGTLLNRPYNEYYVMIYNAEDVDAVHYSSLITKYQKNENALKIYFCDLNNSLNSAYVSKNGESNPNAKTIEELKFGEITLIKVKDGKINKYIEDLSIIKSTLQ